MRPTTRPAPIRPAGRLRRGRRLARAIPAVIAGSLPGAAVSLTLSPSPDLGTSIMPVVLSRDDGAISWGRAHAQGIGPSDPALAEGCGGLATPGVYYLDVPVTGFPQPSGLTDASGRLLDPDGGAGAPASAVGADVVARSGFVVRVAPDGAAPRDDLDLIGVELGPAPVDVIAPVAVEGVRSASRALGRSRSPIAGIEVDPYAHLADRQPAFFAVFDLSPATAVAGAGQDDAVLVRAAFDGPAPTAREGAVASNAGWIGTAGFRDPADAVVETATGRSAVGTDAVMRDAAARPVETPFDLSDIVSADATLAADDTVWLYPAAGPGYLQELDAKGTITFTSFRAPVELILPALDCVTPVGADIVEAVVPPVETSAPIVPAAPLLAGLGPLPSLVGSPFFGTPVAAAAPRPAPPLIRTARSRGGVPTVPGFPGGGGGSRTTTGANPPPTTTPPTTTTPPATTPPPTAPTPPPPSPVPLPAGAILYGGALLLGAGAWRLARRGTPEVGA